MRPDSAERRCKRCSKSASEQANDNVALFLHIYGHVKTSARLRNPDYTNLGSEVKGLRDIPWKAVEKELTLPFGFCLVHLLLQKQSGKLRGNQYRLFDAFGNELVVGRSGALCLLT